MSLTRRLLLGSTVVIVVLVTAIVTIAGSRLRSRLRAETVADLTRSARTVALLWQPGRDADSLADAAGAALGRRVTLVGRDGIVRGDSKFPQAALRRLENHATRPEVVAAMDSGVGVAYRQSASAGDDEVYVAVRHPLGYVRVAIGLDSLNDVVAGAQRDVIAAGALALLGAFLLAALFARSVSRPVIELRNVARAVADGDLTRRPSLNAPGEIGDLSAAVHRMTEQLAGRLAALQAEEALMHATIDALDEGIVVVNGRYQVVRLNSSARRLLAVPDAVPFAADRLPPGRTLRETLRAAAAGESPDPAEMDLDGRILALVGRPLPNGGAVLALQDLTARRRLETVRREFVANASHELKTPLTVVSGFAETLVDPDLSRDDRQRFAAMIRANAQRMQRIVDDLLDLSRYESGSWKPEPRRVDIRQTATDVAGSLDRAARAKGLALSREIPDDAAFVRADAVALRQILSNLMENAVRYTNAGSVTLFASREEGGVRVGVSDTGIGIAPEHLGRIFERFYRVDAARSREEGGTGLGLAIVKHLAEAHGGSVRAESVPGQGSTISVLFPDEPGGRAG
ncbi:MAG: HAMP domain-containing protein [Gemmatimonadota bacterium]|nr:HAMP domain-containing protein [Gemmatimonadota bacterium]